MKCTAHTYHEVVSFPCCNDVFQKCILVWCKHNTTLHFSHWNLVDKHFCLAMHMRNHKCNLATAQCLGCYSTHHIIWLFLWVWFHHKVDRDWSSLEFIFNKFQTKNKIIFSVVNFTTQNDKMIIFSTLRSKRWKNNFFIHFHVLWPIE